MRNGILFSLIFLAGGGGLLGAWLVFSSPPSQPARNFSDLGGDVNRGAYVARLSACITCHTDFQNNGAVLAGGAALETPFGTFYPPNITPDTEFGIGSWSLQDFANALTQGISPDGTHYVPGFPYPFYQRMSNQDIVDLWAAVRSVPAVNKPAPRHDLVIPLSTGLAARAWKNLFFNPAPIDEINDGAGLKSRGKYLAEGPAHCGACHTPRSVFGARKTDEKYSGGVASNAETAPPITPDALQKNGWTQSNLAYALRTGLMPDGDSFSGSMAKVVNGGTRFWTNNDIEALANYLLE